MDASISMNDSTSMDTSTSMLTRMSTALNEHQYDELLEICMDLRPDLQTTLERRGQSSIDNSTELIILCTLWVLQYKRQSSDVRLFIKELDNQGVSQITESIQISIKGIQALNNLELDVIYKISTAYDWDLLQHLVHRTINQFRHFMFDLICTRFKDIHKDRARRYLGGEELTVDWLKRGNNHIIPPNISNSRHEQSRHQTSQEIIQLNAFIEQMMI